MTNNIFYTFFLLLNLIIFFNYEKISKIINIYDFPNNRKLHKEKTPLIGGFILVLNLLFFSFLYLLEQHNDQNHYYFFS